MWYAVGFVDHDLIFKDDCLAADPDCAVGQGEASRLDILACKGLRVRISAPLEAQPESERLIRVPWLENHVDRYDSRLLRVNRYQCGASASTRQAAIGT